MNLLLVEPGDFIDSHCVRLQGRRHHHLNRILKVAPGRILPAGLLNGKMGTATVLEIDKQQATLRLQLIRDPAPPAAATLVLALPRPLMFKRILQSVTTLGVKDIHFIHSGKVEKSYWNSSDLADEVIREQLLLGLEQAMDTTLPRVAFHRHFDNFARDVLPSLTQDKRAFLAHPGPYEACPSSPGEAFVLAIGPEGGFIETEAATFIQHRFAPVQLGPRILRVETAVPAFLGRLLLFS